jgi:hypothetical protein
MIAGWRCAYQAYNTQFVGPVSLSATGQQPHTEPHTSQPT